MLLTKPISALEVPFICQQEQPCYRDNSCGAASLLMMLMYHGLEPNISYEKFCQQLNIDLNPSFKGHLETDSHAVYPQDMHQYLVKNKIPYRVHFYPEEWSDALKIGPVAVLIAKGNKFGHEEGHWMLVIGATDQELCLYDPWKYSDDSEHKVVLSYSEFYEIWARVVCQVIPH